jgi:hypothetical protein
MKRIKETTKWIKLEKMIDKGITSLGKLDFCSKKRSWTNDGVAFERVREKNCHGRRPLNRKR